MGFLLDLEKGTWLISLRYFDTAWILSRYLTCFWKHFHNYKILGIQSNLKIVNYLVSTAKLFIIARLSVCYLTNHYLLSKLANWSVANYLLFPGYSLSIHSLSPSLTIINSALVLILKQNGENRFNCDVIWSCVDFLINYFFVILTILFRAYLCNYVKTSQCFDYDVVELFLRV